MQKKKEVWEVASFLDKKTTEEMPTDNPPT